MHNNEIVRVIIIIIINDVSILFGLARDNQISFGNKSDFECG